MVVDFDKHIRLEVCVKRIIDNENQIICVLRRQSFIHSICDTYKGRRYDRGRTV